jgi:flagella basal body P-ring formation protein FlgA
MTPPGRQGAKATNSTPNRLSGWLSWSARYTRQEERDTREASTMRHRALAFWRLGSETLVACAEPKTRMALFAIALLAAPFLIGPAMADSLRVVVPAHDIPRGVTIQDSDLAYQMVPTAQSGTVLSMNDLVGMEARRFLHAGETVRGDDVRHPVVVTKGSIVTMVFEAPGVQLTATGKAMSEGGIGDSISVVNPVSFRQVTCVITGPGTVRALGGGMTITGNQFASNIR